MLNAVGSSLLSVTAFGLTTAANYAWSGLIDWPLGGLFVAGGLLGGSLGARSAKSLSSRRGALTTAFAALIFAVAVYMLVRSLNFVWEGSHFTLPFASDSEPLDELLELGPDLFRRQLQSAVFDGLHGRHRIYCGHFRPTVTEILHHNVARKHSPDLVL